MKTMLRFPLNMMISICDYLLENCKSIFDQHTLLLSLYPYVQDIRNNLIWIAADVPNTDEMNQLQTEANELDERHDALNRAVYFMLGALAERTQDVVEKATLFNLRDVLFPMDLRINRLAWMAEAGEAQRLAKQLDDPAIQIALNNISIQVNGVSSTAFEWIQDIVQVGQKLGGVARKLTHFRAVAGNNPPTTMFASIREARQEFFQMIRLLQETAQVALRQHPQQTVVLWKALNESLASLSTKKVVPASPTDATAQGPSTDTPAQTSGTPSVQTSGNAPAQTSSNAPAQTSGSVSVQPTSALPVPPSGTLLVQVPPAPPANPSAGDATKK